MGNKILRLLAFWLVALPFAAFGQTGSVTGRVVDFSTGEELPGTNVYLLEIKRGASSGIDGKYEITQVPAGSYTLVASFLGYKQYKYTVEVGSTELNFDIQLTPDYLGLEEVFVTAYGVEKTKNELSYAAQKVDGEDVAKSSTNNFVSSLSGRVAGVNVTQTNTMGGSTNIVIRGYKSLTGSNQALFVIDGVPFDNSNTNGGNQQTGRGGYDYGTAAADFNPDDIASINVLKGPAATALYGSRAANGVVVITTKKGKKGSRAIGVTVGAGVQIGKIDPSTFLEYQTLYGGGYGPYYSGGSNPFLYEFDLDEDGTDDFVVPTTEDASYGAKFDPNLMVYQWDSFDPNSPNFGKKTAWVNAPNGPETFFETAVNRTSSVSIDGGTDRGTYKLAYNYSDDNGILPNSNLTKNFVNFSASHDVTGKLTASASVNFSEIKGSGRFGTGYDDKNLMTNFRQWWQTNVDLKSQEDAYFRNKKNITWNWADFDAASGPIYWDNPYFTRYENFQNDTRVRYFGNMTAVYKLNDWINITGRAAIDSYDEIQEERQAVGSVGVSAYSRFNRTYREYNYDLLVNFNRQISEDLKFTGMIGSNIRRQQIQSIFAATNGGLVVPRLYSVSNSLNPINAPTEFDGERGIDGYFVQTDFNYKNYLILNLTGRRDESSTLPADNNTYYYPSVSTALVFSELMKGQKILEYGKLRLNYAAVGADAPFFALRDNYTKPTPFGSTPLFSVPGTKNNPDLKPEQTKSTEIGLELTFAKGRIAFDLTAYNASTVDQIIPVDISTATGYNSRFINAGEVENKGYEVAVQTKPIVLKDFTWNLDVNWSRNRNKVVDIYPGIDNIVLGTFQGGISINAALGQPYGTIRGTDFLYHEGTGEKIVAANGFYARTTTSNNVIGDMNPDWLGSISNRFSFKNISASFLIDARKGGDIFSLDQYYGQGTGLPAFTAGINDLGNNVRDPLLQTGSQAAGWVSNPASGGVILPGVLADGTPNTRRVRADNYAGPYGWSRNPNAAFIYDGSFLKLREVAITYSFSKELIEKIGTFSGIDLSLVGRNLWIIDKNLPDADPEESISSGNLQGYQGGAYPTARTFAFNVKMKF